MSGSMLLVFYLIGWVAYLFALHFAPHEDPVPQAHRLASQSPVSLVALVMIYVFFVRRGETVAQFTAGSPALQNTWTLWFEMWPLLLLLTGASALFHIAWALSAAFSESRKAYVPIAQGGAAMSAFAFVVVAANFPDA